MKKFLSSISSIFFLSIVLLVIYYYREDINTYYMTHFSKIDKNITLDYKNDYTRNYTYNYITTTDEFLIKNKEQIINIYYTVINSGINEFSFYCSNTYKDCINDISEIANNQIILSNINSFVHPYNSFSSIETKYDSLGKITVKINKSYTEEQIQSINSKVKDIIKNEVKDETNKKEIIKIIHDYIINNSKYDSDKSDKNITNYLSSIAYGPLLQGYGLCGGYTDAMAIFLDYFNIPNFKVISENHIWNAVYIENNWYHLDLTWDDPVVSDGSNTLDYTFFLINDSELEKLETNQHIYDKNVFVEVSTNTHENI
ncbi:MAG: transglutaminase domain-containing protein [bacterium]|nr:transglutaminase domain-containing protein [bacterium]